ncbi:hypothetical protein FNV43_RR21673 [Rhamnella rubrinervis]|uniref:Uncharacterized protein n=1 Tax=Rhamnella rubrinervis TaxID=2594499 RepID=A0A8K0DSW6_9ROSA|nr:hypothetical protein FNV43_RR21673 [Rhamnella rubrinervis]
MFEVVGVIVPRVHEMSLIATVHNTEGRKPFDAPPVVKDKPDVNLDADRVHSIPYKIGTKKSDVVKRGRQHSSPSAYTLATSTHQSSPIASPEISGWLKKKENSKDYESLYNCQSLRRKMIHTLPMSDSVTFDPYRLVSDEVTRQYAHFMDTNVDDQTVELF